MNLHRHTTFCVILVDAFVHAVHHEQIRRAPEVHPVGHGVGVAVLAVIGDSVAIVVGVGAGDDVFKIRHAVLVAVGVAVVGEMVAVLIGPQAQGGFPCIGHAVAVAVSFADVGDPVVVDVGRAQGDLHRIELSVLIAVLARIRDVVAVGVGALPQADVRSVIDAVAVAVERQAAARADVSLHHRFHPCVKAQIDVGGVAGMRVAVAHDRAARRRAVAAVVDHGRVAVVRVQRARVVPHFVRHHNQVPGAQGRAFRRVREGPVQESGNAEGSAAHGGEVRDAAVREIAASRQEVHVVETREVLVELPVRRQGAQVVGGKRLSPRGPQPHVIHDESQVHVVFVEVACGTQQLDHVSERLCGIAEELEEQFIGIERHAGQARAGGRILKRGVSHFQRHRSRGHHTAKVGERRGRVQSACFADFHRTPLARRAA